MAQFKALSPDVKVNGQTVLAFVDGLGGFREIAIKVLAENHITDIAPDKWFLQQDWLNAFKDIMKRVGPATTKQIGIKIPADALWPPDVKTVSDGLASVDVAYHMNHKDGPIGNYTYESTGEKSGRMLCTNPYPCDFDMGIIQGVITRFGGQMLKVAHEGRECRKNGDEKCTYLITWVLTD